MSLSKAVLDKQTYLHNSCSLEISASDVLTINAKLPAELLLTVFCDDYMFSVIYLIAVISSPIFSI